MSRSRDANAPNYTASEPATPTVVGWDLERIRRAERAADMGELTLAADLCELMMGDDRLSGVLDVLSGVWSLPLSFEPANANGAKRGRGQDRVCQALEVDYWGFLSEDLLGDVLRWSRLLGVALIHVREWKPDEETGRLLPALEVWSPKHLRYDNDKRAWVVRTVEGDVTIEPGDGRWMVHCPYGHHRPTTKAPWHGLARWWLLKQFALADWGFYSNKHGNGVSVLEAQPNATKTLDSRQRRQLADEMRAMGRNGAFVVPEGFTYKLVEAAAKTYETFREQLNAADTAFAVTLKGSNLTTEVQGGSFAAATIHAQVDASKIRHIAESWSTDERTQLLVWWARLNFGDPKVAPWSRRDTSPASDLKADVDRFSAGATALSTLTAAGYEVDAADADRVSELLGVRVKRAALVDMPFPNGDVPGNRAFGPKAFGPRASESQPPTTSPLSLARGAYLEALTAARSAAASRDGAAAADTLTDQLSGLVAPLTQATADELLAALDELPDDASEGQIITELATRYRTFDPVQLADTIERALVLAQLAGRATALAEV